MNISYILLLIFIVAVIYATYGQHISFLCFKSNVFIFLQFCYTWQNQSSDPGIVSELIMTENREEAVLLLDRSAGTGNGLPATWDSVRKTSGNSTLQWVVSRGEAWGTGVREPQARSHSVWVASGRRRLSKQISLASDHHLQRYRVSLGQRRRKQEHASVNSPALCYSLTAESSFLFFKDYVTLGLEDLSFPLWPELTFSSRPTRVSTR